MPRYFKWEGIDDGGRGRFCEGTIEHHGAPGAPVTQNDEDELISRLKSRGVAMTYWRSISVKEYVAQQRDKRGLRRFVGGVIGLAGCSAAAILLPMPVAIWAASAFAALTVAAAVPP